MTPAIAIPYVKSEYGFDAFANADNKTISFYIPYAENGKEVDPVLFTCRSYGEIDEICAV